MYDELSIRLDRLDLHNPVIVTMSEREMRDILRVKGANRTIQIGMAVSTDIMRIEWCL